MSDNTNRSFDEMFAESQKNKFSNPKHPAAKPVEQGGYLKQGEYQDRYLYRPDEAYESAAAVENPTVMERTPAPERSSSSMPTALLFGVLSIVLGVLAFIFVFVGMFVHAFMWIGLVMCLAGIVLSFVSLFQPKHSTLLSVIGLAVCIFSLLFDVICMIVVAVGSGIYALFNLFT